MVRAGFGKFWLLFRIQKARLPRWLYAHSGKMEDRLHCNLEAGQACGADEAAAQTHTGALKEAGDLLARADKEI